MARRYDVDFGERRLTVADSQVVPDGSAAVVQHDGKPMASVPQWLSKSAHVWVQCPDVEKAWKSLNRHQPKTSWRRVDCSPTSKAPCCAFTGSATGTCPKAKWNAGKDLPTAAAREVHEECGVPLPIVGAPFAKTFHVYGRKDDKMKVTQWYAMAPSPGSENVQLQPQTEEGITEVRWAMPKEVAKMEPDAFGNIARLMNAWRASQ